MTSSNTPVQINDALPEHPLGIHENNPPLQNPEHAVQRAETAAHSSIRRLIQAKLWGIWRLFWKPFTVFRIGNVPVQIHSTCIVIPLWMMTQVGPPYLFIDVLSVSLVFFSLFFFSLLVHEFGHAWAARMFGIPTRRVIILPIAALALLKTMPRGIREFWIAAAGPLASLILAGILWLIAQPIDVRSYLWIRRLGDVLLIVSHINLLLALYNLIPCHPLDGGRMLRSLLTVLIGRTSGISPDQAFLLATKIAVRYIAWLAAIGMITVVFLKTQFWFDAVLFLIVLTFGEIEYWFLRTEPNESKEEECPTS